MNLKNLTFCLFIFAFASVQAQNEGDVYFSSSQVHEIHITFNQSSDCDSLTDVYSVDCYFKENIEKIVF
jgi:hypothetical protein